jgi:hypothetical protein
LAGKFFPGGGFPGAALLLGLASYEHPGTKLSRAGGFWEVAVREMRTLKAFDRKGRKERPRRAQRKSWNVTASPALVM